VKNVVVEQRQLFFYTNISIEISLGQSLLMNLHHPHLLRLLLLCHHQMHQVHQWNRISLFHQEMKVKNRNRIQNVVQFDVSHLHQQKHHQKQLILKNHFIRDEELINQILM
jgi:hypothetical protein